MLPYDLLPWNMVYGHYSRRNKRGVQETMLKSQDGRCRKEVGRNLRPSYGIIDPQSAKTQFGSDGRGIDGNKLGQRPFMPLYLDSGTWESESRYKGTRAASIHDTVAVF